MLGVDDEGKLSIMGEVAAVTQSRGLDRDDVVIGVAEATEATYHINADDQVSHRQYASVRRLAEEIPDPTQVLPPHGFGSFCSAGPSSGANASTLGQEKSATRPLPGSKNAGSPTPPPASTITPPTTPTCK